GWSEAAGPSRPEPARLTPGCYSRRLPAAAGARGAPSRGLPALTPRRGAHRSRLNSWLLCCLAAKLGCASRQLFFSEISFSRTNQEHEDDLCSKRRYGPCERRNGGIRCSGATGGLGRQLETMLCLSGRNDSGSLCTRPRCAHCPLDWGWLAATAM